jgi:hypothetical protein
MMKRPFETSIAELDSTNASPEALSLAAAGLLGINLEERIEQPFVKVIHRHEPESHGLKEQYLLRWLLKKLNVLESKKGRDVKESIGERYEMTASFPP